MRVMPSIVKTETAMPVDGRQCHECHVDLAKGELVDIFWEGTLFYVHLRCFRTGIILDDESTSKDKLACPYCGITVNPKDGVAFSDAGNPGYSLGNHKKWCSSNPRHTHPSAPSPVVTPAAVMEAVSPTTTEPETAPVAPPAPVKAPLEPRRPVTAPTSPGVTASYAQSIADAEVVLREAWDATPAPTSIYWSPRVVDEIDPIVEVAYQNRMPILVRGPSGTGKTVYARHLARKYGAHHLGAMNFSEHMRMDTIFGQPVPIGNGQIGWNDGKATAAARHGGFLLLEEFTRSGEAASRAFSVLDQVERSLYLPENPFEAEVPVHPDFWVIATANPVGMGYTTKEMDTAMRSRFLVIEANFPFADELKVITDIVGPTKAAMIVDMFETLRSGGLFYPNTRDMVKLCRLVAGGIPFRRAAESSLITMAGGRHELGVRLLVEAYDVDAA